MLDDKSMAASSISLSGTEVLPGFFAGKYKMIMAGNYVATQIDEKAPDGFEWTMLPLLKGTSQAQLSNPQTRQRGPAERAPGAGDAVHRLLQPGREPGQDRQG